MTEEKKAARKTPTQIMKDLYGSKKSLVSTLAGRLERREKESKGDFEKRLMKVPAQKLMRLMKRAEQIDAAGGRNGMVDTIHDFVVRAKTKKADIKEDINYKKHLAAKTAGDLLDRYRSIQRKVRSQSK